MNQCLFCRIVTREIPAEIVAEDEGLIAFKDINPQAPIHFLIMPKMHIPKLSDLTDTSAQIMAQAVMMANRLAKQSGVALEGYRLGVNCGSQAGQSVWHLHLHVLGGRAMRWPPG
jgi:histidine triad (HIT) family protein